MKILRVNSCPVRLGAACVLALVVSSPALAQQLSVQTAVDRQEVFLGESVTFQISVSGSDSPDEPDLSALTDFSVQKIGGQQNNSESITIINGQMSRAVSRGYVLTYQLTPKRLGMCAILPINITAQGQTVQTPRIRIMVSPPGETDEFKLRLKLSKSECYAGEPIRLSVIWYISKEVQNVNFSMPVLKNDSFTFADPENENDPSRKYFRIPVSGGEVIGVQGREVLDGREFTTITFSKVLIPKHAGTFEIPQITVTCEALVGYQKSRSPFDDFFGGFFGGRRGVFKKVVVPSDSPTLRVTALPEAGKPANFAGHVGEYKIEANAAPTEVSVGDPITLTITISGPEYLQHVRLPALNEQPALARDFKIPLEMAAGEVRKKAKVFTQTIRATNAGIKEIPPIELPYFDTKSGKYSVAATMPILITVKEVRVVRASDAEGLEVTSAGSALERWSKGIAHNYDGADVLKNQEYGLATWIRSPAWILLIGLPPFIYFVALASATVVRRRLADPASQAARKAYGEFRRSLRAARHSPSPQSHAELLAAIRSYFGSKLWTSAGALTFKDVELPLKQRNVDADTLAELKQVFDQCEASSYAGGIGTEDLSVLFENTERTINRIERISG